MIRRCCYGKATAVVINYFLSYHSCMAEIYRGISRSSIPLVSAPTTGLKLNSECVSLKPHRLNKLVFSHDNFDTVVESTDSTRSGDEPESRDDVLLALALAVLVLTDFCKYVQVIFANLY
jgi:hypothetical protein